MNTNARVVLDQSEIQGKLDLMEQNGVSPIVLCLLYLLYSSGSRISALLNLTPSDILPDGTCIIRQGKGSDVMRVTPTYRREWLIQCGKIGVKPFQHLNYIGIYRLLKSYGLYEVANFGRNTAVTSVGRKSVARTLDERGENIETIATVLGHKSTKSTEYYLRGTTPKKTMRGGILANQSSKFNYLVQCKNGVIKVRTK